MAWIFWTRNMMITRRDFVRLTAFVRVVCSTSHNAWASETKYKCIFLPQLNKKKKAKQSSKENYATRRRMNGKTIISVLFLNTLVKQFIFSALLRMRLWHSYLMIWNISKRLQGIHHHNQIHMKYNKLLNLPLINGTAFPRCYGYRFDLSLLQWRQKPVSSKIC